MLTPKHMKLVGKVKEAHGLRGDLYIMIFSGDVTWLPKLKDFGLGLLPERGDQPPPEPVNAMYPVSTAKPFKNGLIVKTHAIPDRTAAEKLHGKGFYVPADFFVSDPDEDERIYLSEIEGFKVELTDGDVVGPIIGFAHNGAQDLLVVRSKKGEVEIPFVDAFIVEIDPTREAVVMRLPEGLLDLAAGADEAPDDE